MSREETRRALSERWHPLCPVTNNGVAKEPEGPWQTVPIDLMAFSGREAQLRLYPLVLDQSVRSPGNAYWRNPRIDSG